MHIRRRCTFPLNIPNRGQCADLPPAVRETSQARECMDSATTMVRRIAPNPAENP